MSSQSVKQEEPSFHNHEDLYDATPELRRHVRHQLGDSTREENHPAAEQSDQSRAAADEVDSYPPVTDEVVTLYDCMRMPAAINELPPPTVRMPEWATFSFSFLKKTLGGSPDAYGWYTVSSRAKQARKFPHITMYVALDARSQPLLPALPGQHGAFLSAFMQYTTVETNFPLFIRRGSSDYQYHGTFREPHRSDQLGANEMKRELPAHIKKHWAERLAPKVAERKPRWAITAIKDAWPKIPVGWWDEESRTMIDYDAQQEVDRGEPLMKQISDEEAESVTADDIMKAFEAPDCGDMPSMRLFYEYLECVGYDNAFFDALIAMKNAL